MYQPTYKHTPSDARLFEAFNCFMLECLPIIQSAFDNSTGRFELRMVIITTPHSVQVAPVQVPLWNLAIDSIRSGLESLASHDKLIKILKADARTLGYAGKIYHRNDGTPLTEEDLSYFFGQLVMQTFLLNYLDGQSSACFDPTRFSRIYCSFEESALGDCQTIRSTAILLSFKGPAKSIEVDHDTTIRLATDEDFTELVNRTHLRAEELGVGHQRWLIEIESQVPGVVGSENPRSYSRVETILSAIRLTKAGGAQCRHLFSTRKHDVSRSSIMGLPPAYLGTVSDLVTAEAVNEFRRLYRLLDGLKSNSSLVFVIRRFNFAFERSRFEDRFVDLMVVLESIFVRDSGAGEISYKFRMRMAAFFADKGGLVQRHKVRDIARLAYELRSGIVHGESQVLEKVEKKLDALGIAGLHGLTESIEEYARVVIRALLEKPELANPNNTRWVGAECCVDPLRPPDLPGTKSQTPQIRILGIRADPGPARRSRPYSCREQ